MIALVRYSGDPKTRSTVLLLPVSWELITRLRRDRKQNCLPGAPTPTSCRSSDIRFLPTLQALRYQIPPTSCRSSDIISLPLPQAAATQISDSSQHCMSSNIIILPLQLEVYSHHIISHNIFSHYSKVTLHELRYQIPPTFQELRYQITLTLPSHHIT